MSPTKLASLSLEGNELKPSGKLDEFLKDHKRVQLTPHIGDEYVSSAVQLSDLLAADNSNELIRDLAILVSRRGVVLFKNQSLTVNQQEKLAQKLGELTGKPATSKLHINPTTPEQSELGDFVYGVNRENNDYTGRNRTPLKVGTVSRSWHTDISYEKAPADYAILKVIKLPAEGGGDTLWASGYHAYEKLSPKYREFLAGLTSYHYGGRLKDVAGSALRLERGSPENVGQDLEAFHPIIRTNPVTNLKTLYINKTSCQYIPGLTEEESDSILNVLFATYIDNHDIQVRYKWGQNDVAIWDNRSTKHTATIDYKSPRDGFRVLSVGEVPYLDPSSKSISDVSWSDTPK